MKIPQSDPIINKFNIPHNTDNNSTSSERCHCKHLNANNKKMKRQLERDYDFISIDSEGKKLKLFNECTGSKSDLSHHSCNMIFQNNPNPPRLNIHHHANHAMVVDDEISSEDLILPIEIKLYILEFIQIPLSRFSLISEGIWLSEVKKVMDIKAIFENREIMWEIARKLVRRRMIKLMFGYFSRNVTNLEKERKVYLLYKHVNYEYVGVFGQDEYYSNLRFRDVKSIEFSKDYSLACKFDYWNYMPNLESISGLNVEYDGLEEKFIKNVNGYKLTSLDFGNSKGKAISDVKRFFQSIPNLTRLQVSPVYCVDILGLEKLKHLTFSEGNLIFEHLQLIVDKLEHLETLDARKLTIIASPDQEFSKPLKKMKLKRFYASQQRFSQRFFSKLDSYFLYNLTDIRVGISSASLEQFSNFCQSFPQLKHLSVKGFDFTSEFLREMKHFKCLESFRNVSLRECAELTNIPSLKLLTTDLQWPHSIDFSGLYQIEELKTIASLSLLQNFSQANFLPSLCKISLEIQNELNLDSIICEFLTLASYRPHLKIHLSITPLISEHNFHTLLTCPLIENLTVKCNQIPNSIQSNTTLKKLTLHVCSIFSIPEQLSSNQTIEEIQIFGMNPNFIIGIHEEIFEFVQKSKAISISFIDPDRVGFMEDFGDMNAMF